MLNLPTDIFHLICFIKLKPGNNYDTKMSESVRVCDFFLNVYL